MMHVFEHLRLDLNYKLVKNRSFYYVLTQKTLELKEGTCLSFCHDCKLTFNRYFNNLITVP